MLLVGLPLFFPEGPHLRRNLINGTVTVTTCISTPHPKKLSISEIKMAT